MAVPNDSFTKNFGQLPLIDLNDPEWRTRLSEALQPITDYLTFHQLKMVPPS